MSIKGVVWRSELIRWMTSALLLEINTRLFRRDEGRRWREGEDERRGRDEETDEEEERERKKEEKETKESARKEGEKGREKDTDTDALRKGQHHTSLAQPEPASQPSTANTLCPRGTCLNESRGISTPCADWSIGLG